MPVGRVLIGEDIDLNEIVRKLAKSTAADGGGALAVFIGYVKGVVEGKRVHSLEYEAYEPYASRRLQQLAEEYSKKEGVLDVVIYHRVGRFEPGEPVLYIMVSSITRKEAFEAARELLERVKREVPIFKLERREDGEYWVVGDGKRVPRKRSPGSRASTSR